MISVITAHNLNEAQYLSVQNDQYHSIVENGKYTSQITLTTHKFTSEKESLLDQLIYLN